MFADYFLARLAVVAVSVVLAAVAASVYRAFEKIAEAKKNAAKTRISGKPAFSNAE